VLAIYGFSKINSCREFLMAPPFQIDRVINKLSMLENPKIKANCGRAYKNLNSDVNEAIEEGAVASLIAMSLEVRNTQLASHFQKQILTDRSIFYVFLLFTGQAEEPVQ
jgi:BioD-like phosphotransacetylase family protein